MGAPVILVHGLWMNGLELGVLGHHLRREHGFEVHTYSYPTLHGDAAGACARLADFAARAARSGPVHFVGHSLGGVLLHRMLHGCGTGLDGRVVVLGSPLNGSRAAAGAARYAMLRPLLGPLVLGEIAGPKPRSWQRPQPLGSIAGSLRVGTGQLFARFDEDNDGTVGVSETRIPGLADHLVMPHSHIGMLFAADVAEQVACFLREGAFRRRAA